MVDMNLDVLLRLNEKETEFSLELFQKKTQIFKAKLIEAVQNNDYVAAATCCIAISSEYDKYALKDLDSYTSNCINWDQLLVSFEYKVLRYKFDERSSRGIEITPRALSEITCLLLCSLITGREDVKEFLFPILQSFLERKVDSRKPGFKRLALHFFVVASQGGVKNESLGLYEKVLSGNVVEPYLSLIQLLVEEHFSLSLHSRKDYAYLIYPFNLVPLDVFFSIDILGITTGTILDELITELKVASGYTADETLEQLFFYTD